MKQKKRSFAWLLCVLYSITLYAGSEYEETFEKKLQEQISYHLLIRDYTKASEMATDSVRQLPQSKALRRLHMQALARLGSEKKEKVLLEESDHTITIDFEKELVAEHILKFLNR